MSIVCIWIGIILYLENNTGNHLISISHIKTSIRAKWVQQ